MKDMKSMKVSEKCRGSSLDASIFMSSAPSDASSAHHGRVLDMVFMVRESFVSRGDATE
jgi:hypothetical protein